MKPSDLPGCFSRQTIDLMREDLFGSGGVAGVLFYTETNTP